MTTALYLPEENIGKRTRGRMRQLTSVKNRSDASAALPPDFPPTQSVARWCLCENAFVFVSLQTWLLPHRCCNSRLPIYAPVQSTGPRTCNPRWSPRRIISQLAHWTNHALLILLRIPHKWWRRCWIWSRICPRTRLFNIYLCCSTIWCRRIARAWISSTRHPARSSSVSGVHSSICWTVRMASLSTWHRAFWPSSPAGVTRPCPSPILTSTCSSSRISWPPM